MGGKELLGQQGTGNGEWAMGTIELDGAQDRVVRETSSRMLLPDKLGNAKDQGCY